MPQLPAGPLACDFFSRAVDVVLNRKTKVTSWYLDITHVEKLLGNRSRLSPHGAINMTYALREALQIVLEEGLPERIARHERNHACWRTGLERLGLSYIPEHSLTTLNAVPRAGRRGRRNRAKAFAYRIQY